MSNTHFAAVFVALVLGAALQPCAESATLDTVVSGAEIEGIAHLEYDSKSDRLIGAIGRRLVGISLADAGVTTLATVNGDVRALAIDAQASTIAAVTASDDAVVLLDLGSGRVTRITVPGAGKADFLAYDAAVNGFALGGSTLPELTLVRTRENRQATIKLPGPVTGVSATGRGWIFATAADRSAVYVVDSRSGASLGEFPIPECDRPHAAVLDDVERRIYVVCRNGALIALDSDTGVIVGRSDIPAAVTDVAMPTPITRAIRIVLTTRSDGVWIVSGQITASGAAKSEKDAPAAEEVVAGPDGSVFLIGAREISRLTGM